MQNVQFKSLLLENKQNNRNLAWNNNPLKNQGIDFKNDTLLISSKNAFTEATSNEQAKSTELSYETLKENRVENKLTSLWGKYQKESILNQQATIATQKLTKESEKLTDQLIAQNTNIANFENQKGIISQNINTKEGQLDTFKNQKAYEINAHNNKINTYQNQKSSLNNSLSQANAQIKNQQSSLNSINSNINSLNSQINTLSDKLASAETEEEKDSIRQEISELKSKLAKTQSNKNAYDNNINNLKSKIASIQKDIEMCNNKIATEEINKEKTTIKYNNLIGNLEQEIVNDNCNLNIVNNNLADAVFVQTGLSLQEAYCKEKIKEAHVFEQSTIEMLHKTQNEITTNETLKNNETEKTNLAEKEKNDASEKTIEKQALFLETEKKVEREYQQRNKEFFA